MLEYFEQWREFEEVFGPANLTPGTLRAAYGLAEHCVYVVAPPPSGTTAKLLHLAREPLEAAVPVRTLSISILSTSTGSRLAVRAIFVSLVTTRDTRSLRSSHALIAASREPVSALTPEQVLPSPLS